jgi:NADH oxidase (H2O-forming)
MDNQVNAALNQAAIQISPRVHWIGALDPQLRTFDLILKTANGTTYNAYLVRGRDGVAIIDTVKQDFAAEFFQRLESIADYSEIKIIILNHLEPDHTGALPLLLQRAPQAEVYISFKATKMLKALLKTELNFNPVANGDQVSLGDCKLEFLHTPYLHWPDTQCSYLIGEQILFSGDIFGCHFCDTRLFNDLCGDFRFSFEYYYDHIMRPFRRYVLEALEIIEPLQLNIIAPSHGPILRSQPNDYVQHFRALATPKLYKGHGNDKTLLIFYLSSYGNTARMAQAVCRGAEQVAQVRVSLYDLAGGEVQPFVNLIEEADGIILGSPTINGDATKPFWDLLSSLVMIDTQGKLGAAFGSYGWSGEAVDMLESRMRGLKFKVPLPGLRVKLIPNEAELEQCRAFGEELGKILTGKVTHKVIDFEDLI